MSGYSLNHWQWPCFPAAKVKNGCFIENSEEKEPIFYYPGEYKNDLLSAIQKVEDEESAVQFVRSWGILGLANDVEATEAISNMRIGAFEYVYNTKKKENPNVDPGEVMDEVINFFNIPPWEESVFDTIKFAQWARDISEVKRILDLFISDPYVAEYDAEEWVNNLSDKQYKDLIGSNLDSLRRQYKQDFTQSCFYQYLMELILSKARVSFSFPSRRGVWVQLAGIIAPEGQPFLKFNGLFSFIEYMLLVNDGVSSPKRCADPNCQKLFFPSKAGQKYCPPPPGVKRSRCENRHNKELQRTKKKIS